MHTGTSAEGNDMLSKLHEIYLAFLWEFPDVQYTSWNPGLVQFLCTVHQNVLFLLHASAFNEKYKDLIQLLVCNTENRVCMPMICTQCPPQEKLIQLLLYNFDETVKFSQ